MRVYLPIIAATVWSLMTPAASQEMLAGREKAEFIAGFTDYCISDQTGKYKEFKREIVERYCECVAIGLSEKVPKRLLDNPTAGDWSGIQVRIGEICAARVIPRQ